MSDIHGSKDHNKQEEIKTQELNYCFWLIPTNNVINNHFIHPVAHVLLYTVYHITGNNSIFLADTINKRTHALQL